MSIYQEKADAYVKVVEAYRQAMKNYEATGQTQCQHCEAKPTAMRHDPFWGFEHYHAFELAPVVDSYPDLCQEPNCPGGAASCHTFEPIPEAESWLV